MSNGKKWLGLILIGELLLPGSFLRADISLVSPGKLSKAHRALEGEKNCSKCHAQGKQMVPALCLDCHQELKAKMVAGKGFHGLLSGDKQVCSSCHPEHVGLDFNLIDWGKLGSKAFDHQQSGYPLVGGHAKVTCESCHRTQFIQEPLVRQMLKSNPSQKTYLGLSTDCQSCHFDEHRGQVGHDCKSCHQVESWRPAPLFSHRKTSFPLLGKHKQVACAKCHPTVKDQKAIANATMKPLHLDFMKMSGIVFASCESCHTDVHKGKLGKECSSCHVPEGWKIVSRLGKASSFHQKTRFPLIGAHARVDCKLCHGPFGKTPAKFRGLAFAQCTDCHVDAHLGQIRATALEPNKTCDSCHTTQGFLPPEFEIADHQRSRFPLTGAHRAVGCDQCHRLNPALKKTIPAAVIAQLKKQGRQKSSHFSLTQFHFNQPLERCETCHQDPHRGQFTSAAPVKRCADCHQVDSFHKLSFDHDRDTRYRLTGQHAKAACSGCHQAGYRGLTTNCSSCHDDVHVGQFREKGTKVACEFCHTTKGFKQELLFDHNNRSFSDFPLQGMHAKVACKSCHPAVLLNGRLKVNRYRAVPKTCEGCHEAIHQGRFKDFQP